MSRLKSHQILALNRGEKNKELKVSVETPDEEFIKQLDYFCIHQYLEINHVKEKRILVSKALAEAYKRLVKPGMRRKIRANLTKQAESQALGIQIQPK